LSAEAEYEYGLLNRVDRDACKRLGAFARPENGGAEVGEVRIAMVHEQPWTGRCRRRNAEGGDEGDHQFIRGCPERSAIMTKGSTWSKFVRVNAF
jgi:hypothetical protein